jgi:hypothetical protein
MVAPVIVPLLDGFATRADPRQNAKVSYRLSEIPRVVSDLAGADDFVELTLWGSACPSIPSRSYCRIKSLQLDPRIGSSELPVRLGVVLVAIILPGGNFLG